MISRVFATVIVVLIIVILVVLAVAIKLSVSAEQAAGFGIGFLAAVTFGFAWFRLNDWIGVATSPGRPQTVVHRTDETPRQITWASVRATIILFSLCVGLIGMLVALLHFAFDFP